MSLIQFENVSKIYYRGFFRKKIPAVLDLSFSIDGNSITGFVGPNGAGKTTSIKMMLGMVRPTSGSIRINDRDAGTPNARRGVTYVSEQPYLYSYLTVKESLAFVYKLNRYPPRELSGEIDRVLHQVQLFGIAGKKITDLSKGMQQRLNMAHALLGNAQLYIFDEPMSGLDPLGRKLFRDIFRDLKKKGTCIFFSTHILDDIEQLCDDVVVLSHGRLKYHGKVDELIKKGSAGTEIIINELPETIVPTLTQNGCEITTLQDGLIQLFVPADRSPILCQELLYKNDLYPLSIQPRRQPLESVIYDTIYEGQIQ